MTTTTTITTDHRPLTFQRADGAGVHWTGGAPYRKRPARLSAVFASCFGSGTYGWKFIVFFLPLLPTNANVGPPPPAVA